MNILDKVGEGLASTVDLLVEKNRQMAQLNRLSAVIKTEKDMIDRAYIALGKQYFAMLQGNAEENDMSQVCDVIKFSEERLKKAQARYDYVKVYGVPDSQIDTVDMVRSNETEEETEAAQDTEVSEAAADDEENSDITIAVAEDSGAEKEEAASEEKPEEEQPEVKAEAEEAEEEVKQEADDDEDSQESMRNSIAEAVNSFKKKHSRKIEKDTEAEND